MAVTGNKRQEELNRQQGSIGSSNPYSGLQGVSQNTANNLGNYQAGYKPSETVQQAQQRMAEVEAQKPQSYNSKYAPQLENILQQITNPEKFKYSFDGDELFKYYADLYTQKGKQASMDAMGQAAALTGGYGNSYAQQAGAQAYQQYLLSLYDKGMDLYDRAYQGYRDKLGDQQNAYNYMKDAENTDYSRWQDQMNQWLTERDYAAGRYDTERSTDLSQYQTDRDYWTGLAQAENADYTSERDRQEAIRQYEQNYAENVRQFDAGLGEQQRQYDQNFAKDYAVAILSNGQIPSLDLLTAAGLSYEDALKLIQELNGAGGGGGRGNNGSGILSGIANAIIDFSNIGPGIVQKGVDTGNTGYEELIDKMIKGETLDAKTMEALEKQAEVNKKKMGVTSEALSGLSEQPEEKKKSTKWTWMNPSGK